MNQRIKSVLDRKAENIFLLILIIVICQMSISDTNNFHNWVKENQYSFSNQTIYQQAVSKSEYYDNKIPLMRGLTFFFSFVLGVYISYLVHDYSKRKNISP